MDVKYDTSELDEFRNKMVRFYTNKFPRETRNFMQREGNQTKKILKQNTAMTIKGHGKNPGEMLKGISRGRAEKKADGYQVRVRNKVEHATYFEHGHGMVVWGNRTGGFVEGRHPAAYTNKVMKRLFPSDVDKWIDHMLTEGLR